MRQNPPPNERAADFLRGALFATVVQAFVGAFSRTLEHVPNSGNQARQALNFASTLPGLLTFVGFIGATLFGGPVAIIGYLLGIAGGNIMLPPNQSPITGFFLALLGGTLTWAGVKSGGWRPFL